MSDPLLIVGIAGQARAGKDTIARHLVGHYEFTRLSLADSMRAVLGDMDGPTWEMRKELEAAGKTSRWALQTLGTECRLALPEAAESLWCLVTLAKIRFLSEHMPVRRRRFVIPDIRFPHEPEILGRAAWNWGGDVEVWKVERSGAGLSGDAAKHPSETLIESIPADEHVRNDGSLADLRAAIDLIAMRKDWTEV